MSGPAGRWAAIEEARELLEVAQDSVRAALVLARDFDMEWERPWSKRGVEMVSVVEMLEALNRQISAPWLALIEGPKVSESARRRRNRARVRRETESARTGLVRRRRSGRIPRLSLVAGRWQFDDALLADPRGEVVLDRSNPLFEGAS